jgi:hypothetical protein
MPTSLVFFLAKHLAVSGKCLIFAIEKNNPHAMKACSINKDGRTPPDYLSKLEKSERPPSAAFRLRRKRELPPSAGFRLRRKRELTPSAGFRPRRK